MENIKKEGGSGVEDSTPRIPGAMKEIVPEDVSFVDP